MSKLLAFIWCLFSCGAWAQAVYPPVIPQNSTNLLPLSNTWTGTKNVFTGSVSFPGPCQNAQGIGLVNDGTTDNYATLNTWVTAQGSASFCVDFGQTGTFKFFNSPTYTLALNQNMRVQGEGAVLLFPSSNGFNVTFAASAVGSTASGFSSFGLIYETSAAGLYDAIYVNGNIGSSTLNQPTVFFNNVYKGSDSGTAYFWANGKHTYNVTNIYSYADTYFGKTNSETAGNGTLIEGPACLFPACPNPSQAVIQGDYVEFALYGIKTDGNFQGVNINQVNLTGVGYGVLCSTPGAADTSYQCAISNSQIAAIHEDIIIEYFYGFQIIGNTLTSGVLSGGLSSDAAIHLVNASNGAIQGNNIGANSQTNCGHFTGTLANAATAIAIVGNEFNACVNQGSVGSGGYGILIDGAYSVNAISQSSNRYGSDTLLSADVAPFFINDQEGQKYYNAALLINMSPLHVNSTGQTVNTGCGGSISFPIGQLQGDYNFSVETGASAATSCTLNFIHSFVFAPACTVIATYLPTTGAVNSQTVGATTINWTWPTSVAHGYFNIQCSMTP